jgi:hypothetical protein
VFDPATGIPLQALSLQCVPQQPPAS